MSTSVERPDGIVAIVADPARVRLKGEIALVVIALQGTVRRRQIVGTWPFKREGWESEDFDAVISDGADPVEVSDEVFIQCTPALNGWVLQGQVRGVDCIFGEVMRDDPKGFSFQMMSVPGIEVQARTHIIPEAPTRAHVV